MSVCTDVHDAVRRSGLFARDRPLLVMLSGGQDSICLLDVAVTLLGADSVSALHVNYGLREQADEDESHCRSLCEGLGVKLEVVRASRSGAHAEKSSGGEGRQGRGDPPEGRRDGEENGLGRDGEENGPGQDGEGGGPGPGGEAAGNLQAWARDVRYAEASRLARELDALIAAGHTASDQVETILYRLAASPGRRALLGMVPSDGRLIRPLLGVTREQTAAYCEARGLGWREDQSNADPRFARARVRHEVLPALRAVHPAAESNVLRTAELLREETELLDGLVDGELNGQGSVALGRLREMPSALARLVVVRLAEQATGAYVPQAGARVQELLALGRRGGRAELHVGGQAGALIEDGVLRMVRLPPRAERVPPSGD